MSPDLRTALHDLAPEPPDALGRPQAAYRRAKAIRRRRYAAVASTAVLAVVTALGVTVASDVRRDTDFTGGGKTYPDWPRRGDADAATVASAQQEWARYLAAHDVAQPVPARVLFAGGDPPVVVLHATAERGGERLAVVERGTGGAWSVTIDEPAPVPAIDGKFPLALQLDGPSRNEPDPDAPCEASPPVPGRLLVLVPPGTRAARWQQREMVRGECPSANTPFVDVPLTDAAALVPIAAVPGSFIEVELVSERRASTSQPYARSRRAASAPHYGGVVVRDGWPPVREGWPYRTDDSRADRLAGRMTAVGGREGDCKRIAAFSLPDATPVAVCGAGEDHRVAFWAEGADRRIRVYGRKPHKLLTQAAAVVDGHSGRWLVVVGTPDVREVTLVDGARREAFTMQNGVGWLRITAEPGGDAMLTTPDFGPGGGFSFERGPGTLADLR